MGEPEKHGIKETKEALDAVQAVSVLVASKLKDGLQVYSDAASFAAAMMTDTQLKAKLEAAWEGHQQIPDEIKDLSLAEGFELAVHGGKAALAVVEELHA